MIFMLMQAFMHGAGAQQGQGKSAPGAGGSRPQHANTGEPRPQHANTDGPQTQNANASNAGSSQENPIPYEAFNVLGIPADASKDEIKKAYKNLAMKYHPDKNKTPEATEKMQAVNEAYDKIKKHYEKNGETL